MLIIGATTEQARAALAKINEKYHGNIRFKGIKAMGISRDGKPKVNLTLTVNESRAPGGRLGQSGGHIAAACWHVHGDFMDALPKDVKIQIGPQTTHPGAPWVDRNIGSQVQPMMYSEACDCDSGTHSPTSLKPYEPKKGRKTSGYKKTSYKGVKAIKGTAKNKDLVGIHLTDPSRKEIKDAENRAAIPVYVHRNKPATMAGYGGKSVAMVTIKDGSRKIALDLPRQQTMSYLTARGVSDSKPGSHIYPVVGKGKPDLYMVLTEKQVAEHTVDRSTRGYAPGAAGIAQGKQYAFFVMPTRRNAEGEYQALVAVEGETGFHTTDWYWGKDIGQAEKIAEEHNKKMGLDPKEAMKIVFHTMRKPSLHVGVTAAKASKALSPRQKARKARGSRKFAMRKPVLIRSGGQRLKVHKGTIIKRRS